MKSLPIVLLLSVLCSGQSRSGPVPASFFHITVNQSNSSVWPGTSDSRGDASAFVFAGIRTWNMTQPTGPHQVCPNSAWHCINYSLNNYDFTSFDNGVGKAIAAGQTSILVTMFGSPSWTVTCPTGGCATGQDACHGPTQKMCYPPDDICTNGQVGTGSCAVINGSNPNNDGSDTDFKNWTSALINHIVNDKGWGNYDWTFEIGNEPNYTGGWKGTIAQLVTEACDANYLIKRQNSAWKISSPPPSDGNSTTVSDFLSAYAPSGTGRGPDSCSGTVNGCRGQQCIDVIDIHDYPLNGFKCPNDCPSPENVGNLLNGIIALGTGLPIYVTESSWSKDNLNPSNNDPQHERAAYLARTYIMLGLGSGTGGAASRVYWYCWDCDSSDGMGASTGDLWANWDVPQVEVEAGTAYRQVRAWLDGSTVTIACNPVGITNIMTCDFTTGGGIARRIVWDDSIGSSGCFPNNNPASCATYNVPSQFTKMCTLLGGSSSSGFTNPLQLTSTPILLTGTSDSVCD